MERNVEIVTGSEKKKIVRIHDIRFQGKLGTLAKAKANVTQGIPELLEMAVNKRFLENRDPRHIRNAQYC